MRESAALHCNQRTDPIGPRSRLYQSNKTNTLSRFDSQVITLQSRFFRDRLITTFGLRHDEQSSWGSTVVRDAVSQEVTGAVRNADSKLIMGDTRTAGLVLHLASWLSLAATQEIRSGALRVQRTLDPNAGRAAPVIQRDRPGQNQNPEGETVVLSPFEVTAGIAALVRTFRIYDVADQDGVAEWMRTEFPGMFYILAKAPAGRPKEEGTFRGMYLTGDESLTSRAWVDENVRSRGPLGALYPVKTYTVPNPHGCLKEGDAPSWLFFLPLGGNDPHDPSRPGWGGQYAREPDGWYRDIPATPGFDPRETVSRWRPDFQRDFTRRAAWALPQPAAMPK